MVRQFYLENSLGKRYELTNKNFKQFLNEPKSKRLALKEYYKALTSKNTELNKRLGKVKKSLEQAKNERDSAEREYARLYTRLEKIKELVNE